MKIRVISEFYDKYHTSTRFEVGTVLDFDEKRALDVIAKKLAEPYSEPEKKAEELELGLKVEESKTEEPKVEAEPKIEDDVKAEDKTEVVAEKPKEEVKVAKAEKSKTEGKAQKKADK